MPWWGWFLFGFLLLAGELLTPGGFWLMFFGLGGLAVGVLGLAGLDLPIWSQWLLFTVGSLAATLLLRPPLLARLQRHAPARRADELTGEIATPTDGISPGGIGTAELRGTVWRARNRADRALAAGERCRVVKVDGLLLELEPE